MNVIFVYYKKSLYIQIFFHFLANVLKTFGELSILLDLGLHTIKDKIITLIIYLYIICVKFNKYQ